VTLTTPVAFTSYALKLPSTKGTNGQVLTSDGAGSTSWTTVSGGGGDFMSDGSVPMSAPIMGTYGTSANPSYTFAFDTSAGMWEDADTSALGFSTNGLERMRIGYDGNVGIGTTAPGAPLSIVKSQSSSADDMLVIQNNDSSGFSFIDFKDNLGFLKGAIGYANGSSGSMAGSMALATGTSVPMVFVTNVTSERMRIASGGNVGIGTTAPATKLQVAGVISSSADNTYDLGTSALRFKDIYAANNVIQTSDARLKTDVKDSDLGLDFIANLRPVSYHWKEGDPKLHYGVIAQETEKVLQQAKKRSGRVDEVDNVIVTHDEKTDRYGVRYTELIAPLIKAIQELYADLMGHENRIAAQEREVASVNAKLDAKDKEIQKLKEENAAIKAYLCSKDKSAPICN
jgi:hypothetical protein